MLKLQYFGLMRRTDSLEKTLMMGKDEGQEKKGTTRVWHGWMASPTQWTWVWAKSGRYWRTGKPGVEPHAVHGLTKNWVQLSDWTTKEKCRWQSGTCKWYLKCWQHYETEPLWDQMDSVTLNCRTPRWYLQNIGAFLAVGKPTHLAPSVKEEIVFVLLSVDMVKE